MRLLLAAILGLAPALQPSPAGPNTAPQPTPKQTDASAAAKAAFDKRLEEIDTRAKEIKTLRAKFAQKKHTPLLKKPLESSGKVAIKGDKTRWDTLQPRKSVMTIDAQALRIFYPEQKVVEVYDLGDDVREFAGSPLPRLSKLRESFDISQVNTSELIASPAKDDNPSAPRHLDTSTPPRPDTSAPRHLDTSLLAIELIPRDGDLKKHITRVRVMIDTSIPAARRIEIEDVDAERTEIEFTDIQVNKPIEDADVTLDLPQGTREVHPLGGGEPEAKKPKDAHK